MPPAARITLELFETIARERMGASQQAVLEDLDRLESLAQDVAGDTEFPEDWIIYRITGEQRIVKRPAILRGKQILNDLSALSERLSQQARLPRTPDAIELQTLASRWNVNVKTIDRYRRQGLLARRMLDKDGKSRIFFSPTAIMRFEDLRQASLANAGKFERIDVATKANVIRWSDGYRRKLGWTLNKAAGRIAERTGRSREAVRLVLQSVQRSQLRSKAAATFGEPAPLTATQRKVIVRAMIRGGEPAALARRYKKPLGSIQRAWSMERAAVLRRIVLPELTANKTVADKSAAVLAAAPVNSGLKLDVQRDLAEFLAAAKRPTVPIGVEETARLAGYRQLVKKAAEVIAKLDQHFPRSSEIDEAQTMLRWAARLKAALIQSQFRLITQNLEASLELDLTMFKSSLLKKLLFASIQAAAETVDLHAFTQASSRGRLAAPMALAINRLAVRWEKEHASELHAAAPTQSGSRALSRLLPGIAIEDWTLQVAPWQKVVEPDARLKTASERVSKPQRELLVMRFGWGDGPPRMLGECAKLLKVSSIKIARMERDALAAAYSVLSSGVR